MSYLSKSSITRADAARELLKRRRARRSLIDFARYTHHGYIPADHHIQIAEKLEAVASGEIKRLMIFMPPRHGKSELASRRFPAWFLGNYPDRSIIAASYNSELAGDFGREVRNLVNTPEYRALFDVRLADDSQAAGRWHTSKGGGYVAAGVGTAITGRGAHILLVDDPFKDRESADSEVIREKTYKWYLSTAYTRLEGSITEEDPDPLWREFKAEIKQGEAKPFEGAIVIIQTRWHEDDLSGRLLEDMSNGADQFEVLSLSATKENDTIALWPGKYPIERLMEIKRALPHRDWEALYQQNPTPDEGTFFKREWFKRYRLGEEPKTYNYQSSDFAVTKDEQADYTEFGIFGMDSAEELWVLDWWYGQTTSDKWIDAQLDQIENWKPFATFGESGVIRRAVEPFQAMRARQRKIYPRWEWITRTGDKMAMARAFQGMASMGMIHIPLCDWGERLIDQLVAFPAGKDDHSVDVCALMAMAIMMAHPAMVEKPEDEQKRKPVDYGWSDDDEGESWQTA